MQATHTWCTISRLVCCIQCPSSCLEKVILTTKHRAPAIKLANTPSDHVLLIYVSHVVENHMHIVLLPRRLCHNGKPVGHHW